MSKGIIKFPIIRDSPAHWWVLNISDVFGPHTSRLQSMETYAKYKVFMIKKEGDTSHFCQSYDQDAAKKDKSRFRYDTSVLCLWIPTTRVVLNYWCMVNVGLQDVKKLPI